MPSVSRQGLIHLGMDVHRDSISVAVLEPDRDAPEVDRIFNDEYAVRRLIARFSDPRRLRVCSEAGPTGYELHRLLSTLNVACDVVAPSLIPKAPGDRVKTDRRDCRRLARLHRAGELVAIRVPTAEEETVRDLCRARGDMIEDRTRARHRLGKFLLRHGRVYREGAAWTLGHERWLCSQRFEDRALKATYEHYRSVLESRDSSSGQWSQTWSPASTLSRSGNRWLAWPPTAGCRRWEPSPWPRRSATGVGSAAALSSWGSAGWFHRSTPAAPRPAGVTSPRPATSTSGPNSWSPHGPTSTARPSAGRSGSATRGSPLRWWGGPGPRSCGCAVGSAGSPDGRTPATWSSPPSPGSSLGSCGPR